MVIVSMTLPSTEWQLFNLRATKDTEQWRMRSHRDAELICP